MKRTTVWIGACAPLAAAWLAAANTPVPPQDEKKPLDVKALFSTNCASCHGETGDGKGWAELDRPARSFKDGGFSYGNTPDALFRTITIGIPGTPMPSFESSLTEEQRKLLADYVVTLGPPVTEVKLEETVLEVGDRPRAVRGYLPPIADGCDGHPRGLLLGATSGMTFEYRVDDVRLLGVRQGAFVQRKDWIGRGGAALQPLGQVVHLMNGGKPGTTFHLAYGDAQEPLIAKLTGTWIEGDAVGLSYRLLDAKGRDVARVRESFEAIGTSVGSGFARRFDIERSRVEGELRLRTGAPATPEIDSFATTSMEVREEWYVRKREDGLFEVTGFPRIERSVALDFARLLVDIQTGSSGSFEVTTLVCSDFTNEIKGTLLSELILRRFPK